MNLIITEKPSVAFEIAKIVGANQKENGYLIGNDYIVSWCLGHLITLAQPSAYGAAYKAWSLDYLPIIPDRYLMEISIGKSEQYKLLKKLMERSDITELIEATDAGREGELIFRLVYDMAGCKKPFKRLWISSMEEKSIQDGLETMKSGTEYDRLYQAALCRQKADWLLGINLTRLYSKIYNKKLTCGRVQTPTINMIVQRETEISNFRPEPFYNVILELPDFTATSERIKEKADAKQVKADCTDTVVVTKVERKEKTESPPALYDLTTLQRDANRLLGYTAQQTLDYLQNLYEKKLCTYPRTNSRYLTSNMEDSLLELVQLTARATPFANGADISCNAGQVINDKKVSDHHAVIPTKNIKDADLSALPVGERSVLELVARRLLCAVGQSYIYTETIVTVACGSHEFTTKGKIILSLGWKIFNATKSDKEEKALPELSKGQELPLSSISIKESKTSPPKSYTEDTLLSAMETAGAKDMPNEAEHTGLGTPATRAGIIENIIKTGYVRREGKKLLPTQIAYTFLDILPAYLKEAELTANWEKQLAEIQVGSLSPDVFLHQINAFITNIVSDTKAQIPDNQIPDKNTDIFLTESDYLALCPKCGKKVIEYPKSFSCESGKNGCGFTIWKTIAGKSITKAQAITLLTQRKTPLIKGFRSRSKTGKAFDAYLTLTDDHTIKFDFPKKKLK